MQILLSTAKGQGYGGTGGDPTKLTGLFDPETNIEYGVSYLTAQLAKVGGNVRSAISAYNGGYRPNLGFGAVATNPVRLCLSRDTNGNCTQYRNVAVGEYGNQPYVNAVLSNLAYFESREQASPTVIVPTEPTAPLRDGYRDVDESQTDSRAGQSANRTVGTLVQETIKRLCNFLFRSR